MYVRAGVESLLVVPSLGVKLIKKRRNGSMVVKVSERIALRNDETRQPTCTH